MTAKPFAEQERDLLNELTDLFAFRAEQEQSIAARLREGIANTERACRSSTEQARASFDGAVGAAVAQHQAAHQETDTTFQRRLEGATRTMEAELGAFTERTQSLSENIASKVEEGRWLAETILESGQGRIRTAFETARTTITQRREELDAIERAAGEALQKGRHSPMPPSRQAASEAAQGQSGPVQSVDLETPMEAARDAATRLDRALHPRPLHPLGIVTLMLTGAVIGATIRGGSAWAEGRLDLPMVLPGAGLGAAVGLVVLLAYWTVARRRVGPAARGLHEALVKGRQASSNALRAAAATKEADTEVLRSKAGHELATTQAAVAAHQEEVQKRTREREPELRSRLEKAIGQLRAEHHNALAEIDTALANRRAMLQAAFDEAMRAAQAEASASRLRLDEADRADRETLVRDWSRRIGAAVRSAESLVREASEISTPWTDPAWDRVSAATATPPGVRFGGLMLDMAALPGGLSPDPLLAVPGPTSFDLPLMIDLLGRGSVLLRASTDQRDTALAVLNNILLRLLTGLPPGRARFTIVDPVGLGQAFAGLMHLSDYEEAIVGKRIWTDPRHIEQRLTDLTEHMETVIQKYLRNEFETIQAYNAQAGEVAEPYRFLVIADFPAAITEGSAKRLASIATSGARCGVFTLIMTTQQAKQTDTARSNPAATSGVPWAEIERNSVVLNLQAAGTRWTEGPFSAWPVDLERPPDEAASTRLFHQIGELAKDSTRVRVPFTVVEPADSQVWSGDTASEISLPLGRAGAKKLQAMALGRGTAQHVLIAGRTGSGKSTLLHVIITTAALWYSPDQLELYLVDFKKGVEFKPYATHGLAHARVVAVESEREFGLSVLQRLDAELTRRGALFREAGVQDLSGFRAWLSRQPRAAPLPRIMLIVDEFQEFFVEDDKLAQDASLLLDRLVRQGRAFGMHVVLGSQTLGGAYTLARSTLGQMAVRIALQCAESDSYLIMSEDNPAPRLLTRPGEAIYNDASGLIEGNRPFQVVWLPDEVRESRLERVRERSRASGHPAEPQIVFEGNAPGNVARNHLLVGLLDGVERRPVPYLWIGEPLAIKEPTGVPLRRQSAANVLVVGNQEEFGAAMAAGAVLGLVAWLRGADSTAMAQPVPSITILDATPPDLPHASLLPNVARNLGDLAQLAGPREVAGALAAIAAEIDRRDAAGTSNHAPLLLVVHGLQRFRDLRKADEFSFSSDSERPPSPARMLARVLAAGPQVGIHTLVWCDTATNVDRMFERSALREFNSRVLFQMSAGDSTQLIDSPQASALGRNRALLYTDDSGSIEKFRPYSLPDPEWLFRALAPDSRGRHQPA